MYCRKCGAYNAEGSAFCESCGAPLNAGRRNRRSNGNGYAAERSYRPSEYADYPAAPAAAAANRSGMAAQRKSILTIAAIIVAAIACIGAVTIHQVGSYAAEYNDRMDQMEQCMANDDKEEAMEIAREIMEIIANQQHTNPIKRVVYKHQSATPQYNHYYYKESASGGKGDVSVLSNNDNNHIGDEEVNNFLAWVMEKYEKDTDDADDCDDDEYADEEDCDSPEECEEECDEDEGYNLDPEIILHDYYEEDSDSSCGLDEDEIMAGAEDAAEELKNDSTVQGVMDTVNGWLF